jgi:peptidoglycan/xylan/chitin deacetylase (PgdA/CDA1 family)
MNSANKANLDKAVFIISLDTELAWGTRKFKKYKEHYHQKREMVDRLLDLFIKYDIKATWAIVGHLFLDKCEKINGVVHPQIIRPQYKDLEEDWFNIDPITNINDAPAWYGQDIVKKIINCPTKQEIGCHTFSHIDVSKQGCSEACFKSELNECQKLAGRLGLQLKSFVYPKNRVAMVNTLRDCNFSCFRDRDENWFKDSGNQLRKIAHAIDNYLCLPIKAATPKKINGVWSLPGSYFYIHRDGWAKFIPINFRVRKAKTGIDSAIKNKQIFHLWFHPFNLASDPDNLLRGLEEIFIYFKTLREKELIDNLTMGETADCLNNKI